MPKMQIRDIQLNYRQDGHGDDVVLVHGVAGNMAGWYLCGLVRELSKRFRVTAYDLRGHGYSESTADGYTSYQMAEDLQQLIARLELKNVLLLGHSFRATIALHAAVSHPSMVRGLVLSDVYLPGLAEIQGAPAAWPGWECYKSFAAKFGLQVGDDWSDLDALFKQIAALPDDNRKMLAKFMGSSAVDRLVSISRSTCGRDVGQAAGLTGDRILNVKHPTVCLNGERSPFRPVCEYLAKHLDNCRAAYVAEAEHFAFEENPAEFVRLAINELSRLAGQSKPVVFSMDGQLTRRTDTLMSQ